MRDVPRACKMTARLRRIRRPLTLILIATLSLQAASCGTIIHPERWGQPRTGPLDPSIVVLDGLGVLSVCNSRDRGVCSRFFDRSHLSARAGVLSVSGTTASDLSASRRVSAPGSVSGSRRPARRSARSSGADDAD